MKARTHRLGQASQGHGRLCSGVRGGVHAEVLWWQGLSQSGQVYKGRRGKFQNEEARRKWEGKGRLRLRKYEQQGVTGISERI